THCSKERQYPKRINEIQNVNPTDWRQSDLLGNCGHEADDRHAVFAFQQTDDDTHNPRRNEREQHDYCYCFHDSHCISEHNEKRAILAALHIGGQWRILVEKLCITVMQSELFV